jgi:hypothetical protein
VTYLQNSPIDFANCLRSAFIAALDAAWAIFLARVATLPAGKTLANILAMDTTVLTMAPILKNEEVKK